MRAGATGSGRCLGAIRPTCHYPREQTEDPVLRGSLCRRRAASKPDHDSQHVALKELLYGLSFGGCPCSGDANAA